MRGSWRTGPSPTAHPRIGNGRIYRGALSPKANLAVTPARLQKVDTVPTAGSQTATVTDATATAVVPVDAEASSRDYPVAVRDADGYLTLTGRLKEMINRGGEKIGPREIDEVILVHPAVAEAVAFGVAHPAWGEEVAAAVVLKEGVSATEAAIIAFCKERLADFKVPRKIYIVDSIPRTGTGKISRVNVAKALAG